MPPDAAALLIGRDAELAVLREAWRRTRDGSGTTVLLQGRSGIGKSALVEHFFEELRADRDTVVLSGRCYEQESVPYKALDSLVDSLGRHLLSLPTARVVELLPEDTPALARAFPVLARVEAIAAASKVGTGSAGTDELQRRAFAGLLGLITNLAKRTALALYVDDLQWGDLESAAFFAEMLGPSAPPALFVAGFRSEQVETSPLLMALSDAIESCSRDQLRTLELQPLPKTEIERLTRMLLEQRGIAADMALRIAGEAKGSPYFAHELVRFSASHRGLLETGVDMSLSDVILARVSDLSPEAQRLLHVIAVAGRRLPVGVAQRAAALGPEEGRAFVELRVGHFARSTGTGDQDTIEPYHDRVREALVQSLPAEISRGIHLRIAEALEGATLAGAEHAYAIAHHFYNARPSDRLPHVMSLNLRAATMAADSNAFLQSHLYLGQARQVAQEAGLTFDLRTERLNADVCARIGRSAEAMEGFQLALGMAQEPIERAAILWGVAKVHLGRLETREARREAMRALAELGVRPQRNPVLRWAGTLLLLARGLWGLWRMRGRTSVGAATDREKTIAAIWTLIGLNGFYAMSAAQMIEAVSRQAFYAMRVGPSRELAEWYSLTAGLFGNLRKERVSRSLGRKAIELARQIDDPVGLARAEAYSGIYEDMLGEHLVAERRMDQSRARHAAALELMDYYGLCAALAWNRMMRGRVREAWDVIEDTLHRDALGGQIGAVKGHTFRCYAGPLLAMLGRAEEGRVHLDDFLRLVEHREGDRWRKAQYLAHRLLFLVEVGELDAEFDEAAAQFCVMKLNPKRIPFSMRHVYVAIGYGRLWQLDAAEPPLRAVAERRLQEAIRVLRRVPPAPSVQAHGRILEGALAARLGQLDRAEALWSSAEREAAAIDNVWVLFELECERARAARESGHDGQARRHAEGAHRMAVEHGWPDRAERMRTRFAL